MQLDGATFRYLRHMFGFSLREFAQMCGYNYSYVSMIENGRKPVTEQVKRRFMKVYLDLLEQMEGEMIHVRQRA
jgi:transcriptional regulator with XRE-family HTH domain